MRYVRGAARSGAACASCPISTLDENILSWRAKERVGAVLRGKWRLERLLGVGGMAAVYEGTHRNGKRGAVKVLHLELSMHPDARGRFLQEGYVANRVGHAGAVSVLDDDVAEDGSVFLVMELLEGQTLEELAGKQPERRLGAAEVLAVADQLLDVLAAAHDKGIVHRDLKPENVFLTRDGRVKVLDFGLARVLDAQTARLTRTGNAMGTPAFLPPEQAQGQWDEVDARADLWAAGATLFTLLTGRLVHDAANLNQLLLAAMTHEAPPIRSVAPEVPKPVAAIIDRALAFKRKNRWPDAHAMQGAVREALRSLPPVDLAALHPAAGAAADSAPSRPLGAGASLLTASLSDERTAVWSRRRSLPRIGIVGAGVAVIAGVVAVIAATRGSPGEAPSAGAPIQAAQEPTASPTDPAPAVQPVVPTGEPVGAPPAQPSAGSSARPALPLEPGPSGQARPAAQSSAKPAGSADPFGDFR